MEVTVVENIEVINLEIGTSDSGGSGVGVPDFVINEVPTGVLNNSNALFTSLHEFIPETLEVTVNGLKMKIGDDYTTIGRTQVQLTFSPQSTETITFNYIKY